MSRASIFIVTAHQISIHIPRERKSRSG